MYAYTPLFQMTSIFLAIIMVAHVQFARAQGAEPDDPRGISVRNERERTRASIEQFTGEYLNAIDVAPSFGRVLPPELQPLVRSSVINAKAKLPDKPGASLGSLSVLDQLPPATPSHVKQWIRPRVPLDQSERASAPLFTPDFSRQTLTLAALAGRSAVELPQQDVGAEVAVGSIQVQDANLTEYVISLPDLVRMGLENSPVMDQVEAQLEAMVSKARQSKAQLFPRVTIRAAGGPEKSKALATGANDHSTQNLSMRLTQPLFDLALTYEWLGSLSDQEAAQWRLHASRETVSLAVTQAVVSLASAKLLLDFSDDQLRQFNALLTYVEARAGAGASSQADLERTRTRVLAARQLRIDQQAQYRNAQLELRRLTGQTPSALRLPYLNQLPGLPKTLAEIRQLARENSFDLRALRADVQAQTNTQRSDYGRLLPVLGVSLEYDRSQNVRGINPQQIDTRALAVLTWDISLGGKEVYAVRGATAELNNRKAKLEEETQRTLQAIDADFALLQSASLRVTAGQAEQNAALVVVQALREQLKNGRVSSVIEALDAVDRHYAARQRLVHTLGQQMLAQSQLLRRMGFLSQIQVHAETERQSGAQALPR